jgi:hypothetical protein
MLAIYNFEDGNQRALLVLEVGSDSEPAFLESVKINEYPIPTSGTEVVFILNDKLINQIEIS